ncbi:uroporphyrinogen-III synthase [Pseudochelatococcus contaminans]|uniref:Uroporphyrinogen-III synthase n=1 Tax=Pseudochelatococcus contaminans TaxID=1538103 RepID=A0A7W6EFL4_9HYPH|nr:uroporphyrinogen-III synthase [Pseudochelatococcus contaminans]
MTRVLILRPKAPGLRTASRLAALGVEGIAAPVVRIEAVDEPMPDGPFDAIGITSAAALYRLASLPDAMKALPVLAVGERTALMAREAGFGHIHAADGERHSMAAMARHFFARHQHLAHQAMPRAGRARLLLALGADHKHDTPALLAAAGVDVAPWIVYAARAAEALPDIAQAGLRDGTIDAAMHYSRRSAMIAAELAAQAGLWPIFAALKHYVLSEDVAAPLRERGVTRIFVAERPHEDALLALFSGIDRRQGSP